MSDHLVEDEFTNRPDDDELAFLHYEKLFRKPLDETLKGHTPMIKIGIGILMITSCKPISIRLLPRSKP